MTEDETLKYFQTESGKAAYLVAISVVESPDQFEAGCWCVRDLDNRQQIRDRAFAVLKLPAAIREQARWN